MGGFIPALSAFAASLQGRQQGQADSEVYKQQLQQRQLDQQAKSQELLLQLQAMQRAEKARSGLSPQDQQTLDLGGSITDIEKRRTLSSRATTQAQQWYAMAMDPNRPAEQKMALLRAAVGVQQNPDSIEDLDKDLKSQGVGDKPMRPFNLVDRDTGKPIFYSGSGPVPDNAVDVSVYNNMHKPTAADKAMESTVGATKGLNIVTPAGDPWPSPLDSYGDAIKKGGVPLNDKGKEALDLNIAADSELNNILDAAKGVLPDTSGGLGSYINPATLAAKRAAGDPAVAAFDGAKISLITHLRAVANASRVNQQELNQVNAALARANSYPALQAAVEQARKQLQVSRKYLVKAGKLSTPAIANPAVVAPGSASKPKGTPVYVDGKVVGYTTDGKTMTPVP